jgi:exodeoxyribonuclease VII large subunit
LHRSGKTGGRKIRKITKSSKMGQPAREFLKCTTERKDILTVSKLTKLIKTSLEDNIGYVWITGEIANLSYHKSGHIYFSLRDEEATISAVIWRMLAGVLKFRLKEGMEIIAFGRVSVYAPKGIYQIRVEVVEPKGVGALQIKFEELKEGLSKEGLFETSHKKSIPLLPLRIAIITSTDGAAIKDVLNVIKKIPRIYILIYNVHVQGETASEEIASAIEHINKMPEKEFDLIIVTRGGGSLEDLWAFNEERVARAIYLSCIPVISAVGHEIDYTIADFTADIRAQTPTHAGHIIAKQYENILAVLAEYEKTLKEFLKQKTGELHKRLIELGESYGFRRIKDILHYNAQRLDELNDRLVEGLEKCLIEKRKYATSLALSYRLCNPYEITSSSKKILDELSRRLSTELPNRILATRGKLDFLSRSHGFVVPEELIRRNFEKTTEVSRLLRIQMSHRLGILKDRLGNISAHIDTLSPLKILGRGYSLTIRQKDGKLLTNSKQVSSGECIITKLANGEIISRVIEKKDSDMLV